MKIILLCLTAALACIAGLHGFSKRILYNQNSFLRLFPPLPISQNGTLNIEHNSYYIAGTANDHIYLGNVTSPKHLLELNVSLTDTQHLQVNTTLINHKVFGSPRIAVLDSNFFIIDGGVRQTYRGSSSNWTITDSLSSKLYYSLGQPISANSLVVRATSNQTREDSLIKIGKSIKKQTFGAPILEKQIDGIFCTDGMLHYSKEMASVIYLYYYRNQFIVADTNLKIRYKGNTIDTISRAQIKVVNKSKFSKVLGAPPLMVNKRSCVSKNWLFVNSSLCARNENTDLHKASTVIDVYDLLSGKYKMSFYLPLIERRKATGFYVIGNHLLALYDKQVVSYTLNAKYFKDILLQ